MDSNEGKKVMGNGEVHGIPCKECTAHSGIARGANGADREIQCLRRRFDEYEEAKDRAHGKLHKRIDDIVKSKISIRIFIWVVGSILTAMVVVSTFQWNCIKAAEASNREFHKEVGDKMSNISTDVRVIKSELKND